MNDRLQFSLRTMLILTAVLGGLLGLVKTLLLICPEGLLWLAALAGLTIVLLLFLVCPLIGSYVALLWLAGALMDWLDRMTVERFRIRLGSGLSRKRLSGGSRHDEPT